MDIEQQNVFLIGFLQGLSTSDRKLDEHDRRLLGKCADRIADQSTEGSQRRDVVQAAISWYETRFLDGDSVLANPKRDNSADVALCERIEAYRIAVSGSQE